MAQRKKDSFVYLITNGIYTKIGKAKDPERRLKQLQTGSSVRLDIAYVIWCNDDDQAFIVESHLHDVYKKWRIKGGEWFFLKPDEIMSYLVRSKYVVTPMNGRTRVTPESPGNFSKLKLALSNWIDSH